MCCTPRFLFLYCTKGRVEEQTCFTDFFQCLGTPRSIVIFQLLLHTVFVLLIFKSLFNFVIFSLLKMRKDPSPPPPKPNSPSDHDGSSLLWFVVTCRINGMLYCGLFVALAWTQLIACLLVQQHFTDGKVLLIIGHYYSLS